jgi:hypothetical protein
MNKVNVRPGILFSSYSVYRKLEELEFFVPFFKTIHTLLLMQLLERGFRWQNLPLKESVLASRWPELGLLGHDPEFLVRQSQQGGPLLHDAVFHDLLRGNYSANR